MLLASKTAPKVSLNTFVGSVTGTNAKIAIVTDGLWTNALVTDGTAGGIMTFGLEGLWNSGAPTLVSNPLSHDECGSKAVLQATFTSQGCTGKVLMHGKSFSLILRKTAPSSMAGLYHAFRGGKLVAAIVNENGSAVAVARDSITGAASPVSIAVPSLPGTPPVVSIPGPKGTLPLKMIVTRIRRSIPALMTAWGDAARNSVGPVGPVAVSIGNFDQLGNPIKPFDIAVIPSGSEIPSLFMYSEQVERRIVLQVPFARPEDGSQVTVATATAVGGNQVYNLATLNNGLAVLNRSDPGFAASRNYPGCFDWILSQSFISKLASNGLPTNPLTPVWFFSDDGLPSRSAINLSGLRSGSGFIYTRDDGHLFEVDAFSNSPGQVTTVQRASIASPPSAGGATYPDAAAQFGDGSNSLIHATKYPNVSGVRMADAREFAAGTYRDSLWGLGWVTSSGEISRSSATLDFDTRYFCVMDAASFGADVMVLLSKRYAAWHYVPGENPSASYPHGIPRWERREHGSADLEEYDSNSFGGYAPPDQRSHETMWALIRVTPSGEKSLYFASRDPLFVTGIDVEQSPEGLHVLVADNGPEGFGGQIIRVAPSEAALAALQQRIRDAQQ